MLAPGPANYGEGVLPGLAAQLGIESIRASVLDRYSLVVVNSWSLSAEKDVEANTTEAGLDSAFIASRDVEYSLRDAKAEHTIIRKLSPRLWSFTWLVGAADQLVLVEARYREHRDTVDDKEAALIRLLFLSLAQKNMLAPEEPKPDGIKDSSSSSDNHPGLGWIGVGQLLFLAASVALTGWLTLFALPAASKDEIARHAEISRLHTVADRTVIQHLGKALATGDYGDLQDELSGFHALGYYPRGFVLNASNRVVATVGVGNGVAIGDAIPEKLATSMQSVALTKGNEELGRFISPERNAPAENKSLSDLKMFAAASALASIVAIALGLLLLRRR